MDTNKWTALFLIGTLAAAVAKNNSPLPRERSLIESDWRFHLGDPTEITSGPETNVAYYPEIPNLQKLSADEVAGPNSETNLMTWRPPLAGLGENVSFVQKHFDDSAWRLLNLPHDWVVELPFDPKGDQAHGSKPVGGAFSQDSITEAGREPFGNRSGQPLAQPAHRRCGAAAGTATDANKYPNLQPRQSIKAFWTDRAG
jgi:hypothetical protein